MEEKCFLFFLSLFCVLSSRIECCLGIHITHIECHTRTDLFSYFSFFCNYLNLKICWELKKKQFFVVWRKNFQSFYFVLFFDWCALKGRQFNMSGEFLWKEFFERFFCWLGLFSLRITYILSHCIYCYGIKIMKHWIRTWKSHDCIVWILVISIRYND